MFVIWFTKVGKLFQFVNFHIKFHTIAAFLASTIFLMPLTKQGDDPYLCSFLAPQKYTQIFKQLHNLVCGCKM